MSADLSLTSVPLTTDLIPGIAELEPTDRGVRIHRLPAATRARFTDAQLSMVETQPAGARVALRTDATRVELDILRTRPMYEGVPPRPDGVHDIVVDGELVHQVTSSGGDALVMDAATGASRVEPGPVATIAVELPAVDLPGGERTVEIWLPHNEVTELVDLRSDAPVKPVARTAPRWVHHGVLLQSWVAVGRISGHGHFLRSALSSRRHPVGSALVLPLRGVLPRPGRDAH